jgi:NAD-dependent dihydropyrimidine dehydrogenase PreA subunit
MAEQEIPIHYVCTHDEAKELINKHNRFWVSNCGCREGNEKKCQRSRIDVCLMFAESDAGSGSGKKAVDRAFVDGIMKEAESKKLVSRPFRNEARNDTDGICFCCDDCCGYFAEGNEYTCDKGKHIEQTDMDYCSQCGLCEEVCYFKVRRMKNKELEVNRDNCYGCGLCVTVCPEDCIKMVERK